MEIVICVHDMTLVALSYLVSVLGSFTALQLAVAIPNANSSAERWRGIIFAGSILGVGAIWSMHFIAMLACKMHIEVTYDLGITVVSALAAALACITGFAIVGLGTFRMSNLIAAAFVMGLGVAGMHYLGMAAMIMPAQTQYDTTLTLAAAAIAIVASGAALWLAFNMRGWLQLLGSALVMGVAVCGMHYTAMLGASFKPVDSALANLHPGIGGKDLGLSIFVLTTLFLAVVLALTIIRQQRRQAVQI
jgi:NO-binding membrane sensor protein with MHYT domain